MINSISCGTAISSLNNVAFKGDNQTNSEVGKNEPNCIDADKIRTKADEISKGADAIADSIDKTTDSITNAATKTTGAVSLICAAFSKL